MINLDEFTTCDLCGEEVQGHDVVEDGLFGNLCPRCAGKDEDDPED